uniref:Uncharacterized protein n=1 Tax=Romanomermis culicivorax TaxID=13658 RepID=A0A915IGE6_ROMCU
MFLWGKLVLVPMNFYNYALSQQRQPGQLLSVLACHIPDKQNKCSWALKLYQLPSIYIIQLSLVATYAQLSIKRAALCVILLTMSLAIFASNYQIKGRVTCNDKREDMVTTKSNKMGHYLIKFQYNGVIDRWRLYFQRKNCAGQYQPVSDKLYQIKN